MTALLPNELLEQTCDYAHEIALVSNIVHCELSILIMFESTICMIIMWICNVDHSNF